MMKGNGSGQKYKPSAYRLHPSYPDLKPHHWYLIINAFTKLFLINRQCYFVNFFADIALILPRLKLKSETQVGSDLGQ